MQTRGAGQLKYTPLQRHLAALPTEQTTTSLTFAEIEALIGAPLPATAGASHFWATRQWDKRWTVDFTARLVRAERRVVFVRRAADAVS